MTNKRDILKLLSTLLAIPLFGLGSSQASAKTVKKTATKKTTTKKTKKKTTTKKTAKKTPTRVSEPGTLALMGVGLVAAGTAHKMGRRKKKKV